MDFLVSRPSQWAARTDSGKEARWLLDGHLDIVELQQLLDEPLILLEIQVHLHEAVLGEFLGGRDRGPR